MVQTDFLYQQDTVLGWTIGKLKPENQFHTVLSTVAWAEIWLEHMSKKRTAQTKATTLFLCAVPVTKGQMSLKFLKLLSRFRVIFNSKCTY